MNYVASDLKVSSTNYKSSIVININLEDELIFSTELIHDNFSDFSKDENWEGLREQIECDEIFSAIAEDFKINNWVDEHSRDS